MNFRMKISRLLSETSGNVAVMGAIAAPIALMGIGAAVSMADLSSHKSNLQNHADNMSLAIAKLESASKGREASSYFERYTSSHLKDDEKCEYKTNFSPFETTVSCSGEIPSFMAGVLNKKTLPYHVVASAAMEAANIVEVAFVFDISESMVGQELKELEDSLKVMTASALFQAEKSRLSYIPFANTVRLDDELEDFVTPGTGFAKTGGVYNGCFDRQATDPDVDLTSNPSFPLVNAALSNGRVVCPDKKMTAVFHKKANDREIQDMQGELEIAFGTAMSDGLVWGFRSLDPDLRGILSSESQYPLDSSSFSTKHVIMMTDGRPYDRPYSGPGGGAVTQKISLDRFKSVCKKLPFEEKRINFHLINYNNKKLSSEHLDVFKGCVSGVGQFHDVKVGELTDIVELITGQLSDLRLTR